MLVFIKKHFWLIYFHLKRCFLSFWSREIIGCVFFIKVYPVNQEVGVFKFSFEQVYLGQAAFLNVG